jgi:Flp pilus assembly protein TadD
VLHAERGEAAEAEREYQTALRLSPHFPATYVNLADLYRQLGRESDAVAVLKDGLVKAPGSADIPHALGLALVRSDKLAEALPMLERACTLAPDAARFAYVYAVALDSAGQPGKAIDVLKQAHTRHPGDMDVLSALVAYCHGAGRLDEAIGYAARLATLRPGDKEIGAMRQQLMVEKRAGAAPGPIEPGKKQGP